MIEMTNEIRIMDLPDLAHAIAVAIDTGNIESARYFAGRQHQILEGMLAA
jgi:hypothetical protein